MQTLCPSCGAETFPGARFCRRCGASLHLPGGETGDVSPNAATVPLTQEEPRPTDGLPPADEPAHKQTSRVSLAELERMLRERDDSLQTPPTGEQTDLDETHVPRGPAVTRPDYEEELTITVPRTPRTRETGDSELTGDFEVTQLSDLEATVPSPAGAWVYDAARGEGAGPREEEGAAASPDPDVLEGGTVIESVPAPPPPPPGAGATGARPKRVWPAVVAACVAVVVLAVGAWLAYRLLRQPAVTDLPTEGPTAPPPSADARQFFELKLAEAEAQLASGNMEGALALLREANALDPGNTRAHRRLAELLLSTGARREAIEALRAVVRNAPDDAAGWRQLASAQAAEGLHRDAAESFRRLVALVGEQSVDPSDLLTYADALRLSGAAAESRALYERLTASAPAEVATAARERLAELARAEPTPTPAQPPAAREGEPPPREGETASALPAPAPPTPEPTAAPQPTPTAAPQQPAPATPAERYGRGVQLWGSNRGAALAEFRAAAAGGSPDAHYYLGLAYVEGRALSALKRAEVVAALQHFQLAQRGGQHAARARGYAQQLEREFDRLRRQ